jgi:hypothetical protein
MTKTTISTGTSLKIMTPKKSNFPLFDVYLIVDWSAANAPKRGKDSIWIAAAFRAQNKLDIHIPINLPTRSAAMEYITTVLQNSLANGLRVFVGLDFPFGYPANTAKYISGKSHWSSLWHTLHTAIEDNDQNQSNRYQVANTFNRTCFGEPVYWGHPHQHVYENLSPKKAPSALRESMEFRIVEKQQPPAKSVWQLAYNGAVGSQTLLGIARLETLRNHFTQSLQIWPFETDFTRSLNAPIIIAEIYPSMFPLKCKENEIKDCAQVRTVVECFSELDTNGAFEQLLSKPASLDETQYKGVVKEEGWIVGAGWVG